ncbi:Cytoplasmic polyadenylation element-binding protein 1 [Hypsibius exemplaris]|uniref:Cytoplasmic polyadenylation element-binding protein 1 n=1 Tax=Hypsibius exemplaris TaxID=2072580 RepID=A0A9X6NG27_HYPEX|nr:Cytoplasmic polyadenylation element-binding protein 1 [Hypsibius exemplaris]
MGDFETKEEPFWPVMKMENGGHFGGGSHFNHASKSMPQPHMMMPKPRQPSLFEPQREHDELESLDSDDLGSFGGGRCTGTREKVDLGVGFEETYDESLDAMWKEEHGKPGMRTTTFGSSLGSPLTLQRKLATLRSTTMWKGRSFDSTGNDGMSSSQSSTTSGAHQSNSMSNGNGPPPPPGVVISQGAQFAPSAGFVGPIFDYSGVPTGLDFGSGGGSHAGETSSEPGGSCGGSQSARASGNLAGDPRWSGDMCVERQAQAYRGAASSATAAAIWSGVLPPRNTKGSAFSCKVFLGGVPWDITEADLQQAFGLFGNPKIEWPASHDQSSRNVKGHLYLIFDTEKSVKHLLGTCNYDFNQGHHNWYYKVSSKRMRVKEVQVIPWQLADASYVRNGCMTTFGTKTVFVGSLHGMLTAEGLAKVLDDLFQGVVAATIDTDKYKYPIGSGRVTFNCDESYMKALRAVFVDLRTPKFNKKIQIDPFLEDSACSICSTHLGPYFCRDLQCFSYFCHACWQWQHSANNIGHHIPLMRNPRT